MRLSGLEPVSIGAGSLFVNVGERTNVTGSKAFARLILNEQFDEALAKRIAAKSPLAVAGSKRALNYARDHGTAQALEQMTLLQSAIFDIDEMTAAIAAWKDKREAAFEPLAPVQDP